MSTSRFVRAALFVLVAASLTRCDCAPPNTNVDGGEGGGAQGGGVGGGGGATTDCVDRDGDGFGQGSGCQGTDCNDDDAMAFPGAAERCNALDDNCNSQIDEGIADVSCGVGVCARTVTSCVGGVTQACTPGTAGTETCNGLDDDCNGAVDDGPAGQSQACMTGQEGVCAPGLTQCTGDGGVVCVAERVSGPESCNGLDDNCNGLPDDNDPDAGVACSTNLLGACRSGTTICADGGIACVQLAQPAIEWCNGLDDNCDGVSDEGNPDAGFACNTGIPGACGPGATTCADGGLVCEQLVFPVIETCNGFDDNCDGTVDDGNPGSNVSCNTGLLGICAPGATACVDGGVACIATISPTAESCNGLDDNCDGVPDDNNPDGGVACSTGLVGLCATGASACTSGAITCTQTVTPIAEACNGLDDDCDGTNDNGSPDAGVTCSTGQLGICSAGATACAAGEISCVRTTAPSTEICDGLDNDCDGANDNGDPGAGAACTTGQSGVCSPGITSCTSGAILCNRNVAPSVEVCDGLDNDCDGVVDNGNPSGGAACGTGLLGVCAVGTTSCTGGTVVCNQNVQPSAEVCDGLDNNCNGAVDDGNPGAGANCSTGLQGVCSAGTTSCTNGAIACNQNVMPSAEVCDGLDNNCNGAADDGNPGGGVNCSTGLQGVCSAGTTACTAGAIACNQNTQPSAETCDGLDNDCNGSVDNGNPGGGASCSTGELGVCAAGGTACVSGAIACNRLLNPTAEICDGLDNDCNGTVDNGNPGAGAACTTGLQGVCSAGTTSCSAGAIACNQNVQPAAETCDGLDNNCNGAVDDGNPGGGISCNTGLVGVCSAGTTACTAGAIACNQDVASGAELCDGLDNDCNGVVDEGNPGGGVACNTGQLGVCAAGTTACTSGAVACNRNSNPSTETCDDLDNNCDGTVDNGTATNDGMPNSCAAATGRTINLPVGSLTTLSGYVDANGDDWFQVNFTGIGGVGTNYNPQIDFVANPAGQFKFQVYDSGCTALATCSGAALTNFSMSFPLNPNSCQSYGVCTDQVAKVTSIRVRIFRTAVTQLFCSQYTIRLQSL